MSSLDQLPDRPTAYLTRGSRAAEDLLFQHIEEHLQRAGEAVLAAPIQVVLPSDRLRHHLLAKLMRRRGSSLAGISCRTHRSLAVEIIERFGTPLAPAGRVLGLLARRQARRESNLAQQLDHLSDGYAAVIGPVTDLLEAGLDPAHAEALDEALATDGLGRGATREDIERARALLRVAISTLSELDHLSLGPDSTLLQTAAELVRTTTRNPLSAGLIMVYGFADATGVTTDFLLALLERYAGTIFLDSPTDPANPATPERDHPFTRRFRQRILDVVATAAPEPAAVETGDRHTSTVEMFRATGSVAEVREVGRRIRVLLDAGHEAESIGVVMRRPDPYAAALRTHFWRLGLPFSAGSSPSSMALLGPQGPRGRRLTALLALLSGGERAPVERWLDAQEIWTRATELADLRLALFGLGAARLGDVADLDLERLADRESIPLPARLGFDTSEENEFDSATARLRRRHLAVERLVEARQQAAQLCGVLADWRSMRRVDDHIAQLSAVLAKLGWADEQGPGREATDTLAGALQGLAPGFQIALDELLLILGNSLSSRGRLAFGGRGGGIQIMDVIEARALTFEHVFILGLNKGVFPRTVREDPALPDGLRGVLARHGAGVLPDLPLKLGGFDEEKFLFAQLLSASPNVTLSWQKLDDDGRVLAPSPLVERLRWSQLAAGESWPDPPLVGSTLRQPDVGKQRQPELRTAFENALRAALWGPRCDLGAAFKIAQESTEEESLGWQDEVGCAASRVSAATLANARLHIIDEMNLPPGPASRLGPYFGFVGPDDSGPRSTQKLYVTTLESLARCPWQTFLQRLLRIEPQPDPLDVLPALDPLLIGQTVHRVLEVIASGAEIDSATRLGELRDRQAEALEWPSARTLRKITLQEALRTAWSNGIGWQGFGDVLTQVVLPYLEVARQLAWTDSGTALILATELEDSLEIPRVEAARRLHFKADRVDAGSEGLILIDFKTSRTGASDAKKEETRRRHLLKKIRSGRLLQAAAYAIAAAGEDDRGRYVFVRPDFKSSGEERIVSVDVTDPEIRGAFDSAVAVLLDAWELGTLAPRLSEPDTDKEPSACKYCTVAEGCLRGDSSARGRLRDWTTAHRQALGRIDSELGPNEQAILGIWRLGAKV